MVHDFIIPVSIAIVLASLAALLSFIIDMAWILL